MFDMNEMKNDVIRVYGAGLAGCEAAWQAANRGMKVELYEMKPEKYTPAHHSAGFAELVVTGQEVEVRGSGEDDGREADIAGHVKLGCGWFGDYEGEDGDGTELKERRVLG